MQNFAGIDEKSKDLYIILYNTLCMVRSFVKETTNVGGSIGVIIPKEVCYAEGIEKFQRVRIIIETIEDDAQKVDEGNGTGRNRTTLVEIIGDDLDSAELVIVQQEETLNCSY